LLTIDQVIFCNQSAFIRLNQCPKTKNTPTIQNRKAHHDYAIEDTYEAGIVLQGTEVKSIREGKASFTDAFAFIQGDEVFLRELYVKPYEQGSYNNHDPRRPRKLLLHKKENS